VFGAGAVGCAGFGSRLVRHGRYGRNGEFEGREGDSRSVFVSYQGWIGGRGLNRVGRCHFNGWVKQVGSFDIDRRLVRSRWRASGEKCPRTRYCKVRL
jgi:hypothetical protein